MLFNFNLTPLEQIRPSGAESGNTPLHWFGLTDGAYWIQVDDVALFEYTEAARAAFGCAQYCDYYVVRLYEDFTEILPHILEPVPERLTPHISGSGAAQWKDTIAAWRDGKDVMHDDKSFDLWDAATSWFSQRSLDTGYLSSKSRSPSSSGI